MPKRRHRRTESTDSIDNFAVTEQLQAELDTWKRDATAVTILADASGRPWVKRSFAVMFSVTMQRHGPPAGNVPYERCCTPRGNGLLGS